LNFRLLLLLSLFFLTSCGQLVAFLGPAITAGSTGEIYRVGLSYGSEHLIKRATGKTTYEHVATLMYSE
jgi:hypothetical protein